MADLFISYAREDIDFVKTVYDALDEDTRKVWVDWEGIPPSAEWMREIYAAIEAAPSFLFVISPDSVTSHVCELEIDHAALHNKRIVVVVRRDPKGAGGKPLPVRDAVARVNWIFARETDSFDKAMARVVESLDTDLEHLRAHARLTVRALEWEASSDVGFLLRGKDLEDARQWLGASELKEPEPSVLHRRYIMKSRQAAADALATRTLAGFPDDAEIGVLLADAAVAEIADTPRARFAVRGALAACPLRFVLRGHEGAIVAARWSPDAVRLATAGDDGVARVWDTKTGAVLSTFSGHRAGILTLAWSADAAWIATGSADGTARVWDPANASERVVLRHDRLQDGIVSVAWSADSRRLLTAPRNGSTAIWDLEAGAVGPAVWLRHSRWLVGAQWHVATDRVLLLTGDDIVVAFDTRSGAALFGLRLPRPGVRDGRWSLDGSLIATCSGSAAHVWNGQDGASLAEIRGHASQITSVAFDPASRRLATGSIDRTVRIWDPRTGDELRRLARHENSVGSVAWSPDGTRLLSTGADGTARVWDANRERQLMLLRERKVSPGGAAWAPDGTRFATFGSDGARVYGAFPGDWSFGFASPAQLVSAQAQPDEASASHGALLCDWMGDGRRILTAWRSGAVELRDGETGQVLRVWGEAAPLVRAVPSPDGQLLLTTDRDGLSLVRDLELGTQCSPLAEFDDAPASVRWSPDGTRVLAAFYDGGTKVWDARTGACDVELKPRRAPQAGEEPMAEWSPDGRRVLTYEFFSQGKPIRTWDAVTGSALAYIDRPDISQLWSAEWTPDGRWIVIVGGHDVHLVSPDSGEIVHVLDPRENFYSPGLAFSPDGARVLVGLDSGGARIWDLTVVGDPLQLTGHQGRVHFGVWSHDGQRLVTVSEDKTARVWNASNGKLVAALVGHDGPLHDARWSGDQRLILTRSSDHSARVWDAETGDPIVCIGGIDDWVEDAKWHPQAHRVLVRTESGAWIWNVVVETEPLLALVRQKGLRKLTPDERRAFGLSAPA